MMIGNDVKKNTTNGSGFLPYTLSKIINDSSLLLSKTINVELLEQDIINNLKMIFSSKSHLDVKDELISTSVLCMGLKDFSGEQVTDDIIKAFKDRLLEQISFFEPRIKVDNISIKNLNDNKHIYQIEIDALYNLPLLDGGLNLKVNFDFETGSSVFENI